MHSTAKSMKQRKTQHSEVLSTHRIGAITINVHDTGYYK
jgi:hypothetical protein